MVAIKGIARRLLRVLGACSGDGLNRRRRELSDYLYELFNGTVKYGPLKGLKLDVEFSWTGPYRASTLLGIYEKEILDSLCTIPATHRAFVDIGASDGYYGVGVLVNDTFDLSYCFEASKVGQELVMKNAHINGVAKRVKVHGKAEKGFFSILEIDGVDLSKAVVICDIEGGEFSVFDEDALRAFKGSIIFIELHDGFFDNGAELLRKLKANAGTYFRITELTTSARDLSPFSELDSLSDTDRWLICSEGRPFRMTWLRLDPH